MPLEWRIYNVGIKGSRALKRRYRDAGILPVWFRGLKPHGYPRRPLRGRVHMLLGFCPAPFLE